MTEETENLVLEILKRLQADVFSLKADMELLRPLPARVNAVERQLAGLVQVVGGLTDAVTLRLDQHELRLQRLESLQS